MCSPIIIGTNTIQNVSSFNLLGVTISSDLSWNRHVEYATKKANERLYSLRILKRCGIPQSSLVKVYLSLIRPVLEYAVPVWQNLTQALACSLENVQKRVLHIIFPTSNYSDVLVAAGLLSLEERRNSICHAYVQKLRKQDHPISFLLPREEPVQHTYNLRSGNNMNKFLYGNKKICRTKRSDHFITFKF